MKILWRDTARATPLSMGKLIRRLYDWTLRLSAHKHATWGLAGISFIESSIFPIPPDVVLIPMCISNRKKAFWYATVCTGASVLGGMLGYAIGYFLYETIGKAIVDFYGMGDKFSELQLKYDEWGGWIIFGKGLTPFPYKILTILSGVMHMALPVFIISSICGRSVRFFLVAALIWKYGQPIQTFIEKYLTILSLLFLALIVAGFVFLKYLI